MSIKIAICGGSGVQPGSQGYEKAVLVGEEIARRNGIVVCGGKEGVMEAVCMGSKRRNGQNVGILPYSLDEANDYVDIAIPTGMGYKRNTLIIESADCIIAIAGSWGTLNEVTFAMVLEKPIVFLSETGGFVDILIQSDFLKFASSKYYITSDPKDAVEKAFEFVKSIHP